MTKEKQDYPPLISNRSPSVERARREHEHPSPTTDPELIARLNRLVEAEHDAAGMVNAAMDIARDPALADELVAMAALHQEHARTLADVVSALGGAAPRADQSTQVLSRSPGDLAYVQSDIELLAMLAATADELIARYDDAVSHPSLPSESAQVVAQLAGEVRRMRLRIAMHTQGETRF